MLCSAIYLRRITTRAILVDHLSDLLSDLRMFEVRVTNRVRSYLPPPKKSFSKQLLLVARLSLLGSKMYKRTSILQAILTISVSFHPVLSLLYSRPLALALLSSTDIFVSLHYVENSTDIWSPQKPYCPANRALWDNSPEDASADIEGSLPFIAKRRDGAKLDYLFHNSTRNLTKYFCRARSRLILAVFSLTQSLRI